jgi:hypothetical protein
MAGRLTRFLNLERARKPADAPAHSVANKARFGDAPPADADPDELLRAERAARLHSGVEIETGGEADQPFLRCPVCEADNTRYAVRCNNCQAALDTEEVRAWNGRLWQKRRAEKDLEGKAEAGVEAERDRLRDQNRMLGEALAQQVAERERARLRWDSDPDSRSLGLRLLNCIESPGLRRAVTMALAAGFVVSALIGFTVRNHPGARAWAFGVALVLLVLFTPNRRSRRRWWDWD